MTTDSTAAANLEALQQEAKARLDAHTVEIVQWHFHPSTGSPFWLEKKAELGFDPLTDIKEFDDLKKFPLFEDDWLRGGPIRRWVPKGLDGKPTYVFETGGTTGIPKSRMVIDDFRIDYEMFSETLPDEHFPKGSNWLMLGPSGPRRLRLAVEHLCQFRGGICFCIDLDPRWVVKLIKKGWMGAFRGIQETLYRPGTHRVICRPRYQMHVCDSQVAGVPLQRAGGERTVVCGYRNYRNFFRGHGVHAAVDTILHRRIFRGAARREWYLHDADLRQYVDGSGL